MASLIPPAAAPMQREQAIALVKETFEDLMPADEIRHASLEMDLAVEAIKGLRERCLKPLFREFITSFNIASDKIQTMEEELSSLCGEDSIRKCIIIREAIPHSPKTSFLFATRLQQLLVKKEHVDHFLTLISGSRADCLKILRSTKDAVVYQLYMYAYTLNRLSAIFSSYGKMPVSSLFAKNLQTTLCAALHNLQKDEEGILSFLYKTKAIFEKEIENEHIQKLVLESLKRLKSRIKPINGMQALVTVRCLEESLPTENPFLHTVLEKIQPFLSGKSKLNVAPERIVKGQFAPFSEEEKKEMGDYRFGFNLSEKEVRDILAKCHKIDADLIVLELLIKNIYTKNQALWTQQVALSKISFPQLRGASLFSLIKGLSRLC